MEKQNFMGWLIFLLLIGMVFIFLEIFFIPGGIVGVIGALMMGYGIYLVYQDHGTVAGHITLALSLIIFVTAFVIGIKKGAWERFSQKESLKGRTRVVENPVQVGDKGEALSAIKPVGKARINGENLEVQSYSEYIEAGEEIKVKQLKGRYIYVIRAKVESEAEASG